MKKQVVIYMNELQHAKIKSLADKQLRSVSSMILYCTFNYLKIVEEQQKKSEEIITKPVVGVCEDETSREGI